MKTRWSSPSPPPGSTGKPSAPNCTSAAGRSCTSRTRWPRCDRPAFLFKWYEAEPTVTVDDPDGWKAANPSSWINDDDLKREAERLPENVFRRLHLNQWTEAQDAWIKAHAVGPV